MDNAKEGFENAPVNDSNKNLEYSVQSTDNLETEEVQQTHGNEDGTHLDYKDETNTPFNQEILNPHYEIDSVDIELASMQTVGMYKDLYDTETIISEAKSQVEVIKMKDGSTAPTQEEIVDILASVEADAEKGKNWTDKAKDMAKIAMLTTMMAFTTGNALAAGHGDNLDSNIEQSEMMTSREKAQVSAAMGQGKLDKMMGGTYAGDSYLSPAMQKAYKDGYDGKVAVDARQAVKNYQYVATAKSDQTVQPVVYKQEAPTPKIQRQETSLQQVSYRQETQAEPVRKAEAPRQYTEKEMQALKREMTTANRQGQNDAKSGVGDFSHQYSNREVQKAYLNGFERGEAVKYVKDHANDNRIEKRLADKKLVEAEKRRSEFDRLHHKKALERAGDRYDMEDGKLDQRSSIPKRILDGEEVKNSEYLEGIWDFFNR